jgi:hypothetical protein
MKLRQIQTGQVYVVVQTAKDWGEYPLPPKLVAKWTILSIFRSENTSDYGLVFYNFSQSMGLVPLKDIHIFDWSRRKAGESGLTPAYDV